MLQGLHILIAEDNPVNLKVLETLLKRQGASVTLTKNGKELIEAFGKGVYDVVLTDLHMPIMDGFEAARYLRHELKSEVPVLALSADIFTNNRDACTAAGINDCLTKPFTSDALADKILQLAHPLVDLQFLNELSGSNPAYNSEVIGIFVRTVPPSLDNLQAMISENSDYDGICQQAHQLRSSFSVVRVGSIFELLQQLERLAAAGAEQEALQQCYNEIRNIFDHAMPDLETLCERK